jgi:hypothetical protein
MTRALYGAHEVSARIFLNTAEYHSTVIGVPVSTSALTQVIDVVIEK